jgi:hypothetical protein
MTPLVARLLPAVGAVVVLAGCGTPPEPLPTAPPKTYGIPSAPPSGSGYPSGVVPSYPPPTGGFPAYPTPTYPAYPTATTPTPAATTGPPPAPNCTNGPTKAQVLAVVKDNPGIPPNTRLVVQGGPYCAGTWQFTTLGKPGADPLAVVTNGKPTALKLVELGQDVCSDHVQHAAPVGIRVWACGS